MLATLLLLACQSPLPGSGISIESRVLDPNGRPLVDAVVTWSPAPYKKGAPLAARSSVRTDGEGRFRIEGATRGREDHEFGVVVCHPGFVDARWRWWPKAPGARLRFDALHLAPAASISGTIRDTRGDLLTDGWTVHAREAADFGAEAGLLRVLEDTSATVDDETGVFKLEGLRAGEVMLHARHARSGQRTPDLVVTASAEGPTYVELDFREPRPAPRSLVAVSSSAMGEVMPPSGSVVATTADGARITLSRPSGRSGLWQGDADVGDIVDVHVNDERFERSAPPDLSGDGPVALDVRGSSDVVVSAFDAADSTPLSAADVQLLPASFDLPGIDAARAKLALTDGTARVEGVVAGTYLVSVRADGYPLHEVSAVVGARDEVHVRVDLHRGRVVEGRLVDDRGAALAGVDLELTLGDNAGLGGEHRLAVRRDGAGAYERVQLPPVEQSTVTDDDGRFRFEDVAPLRHVVLADLGPRATAAFPVPAATTTGPPLELVMSRPSTVRVRVVAPPGRDPSELRLRIEPTATTDDPAAFRRRALRLDDLRADDEGVFPDVTISPGEVRLSVRAQHVFEMSSARSGSEIELARAHLVLERGEAHEHVFDLRGSTPVPCAIRLELQGTELPTGFQFDLVPTDSDQPGHSMTLMRPGDSSLVALVCLVPGTYRMRVADGSFSWTSEVPIQVPPPAHGEQLVPSPLIARALSLTGPEGAPLRRQRVEVWHDPSTSERRAAAYTTDESGELILVRPAGRLHLRRVPHGGGPAAPPSLEEAEATVEFGPGKAPLPVRLGSSSGDGR